MVKLFATSFQVLNAEESWYIMAEVQQQRHKPTQIQG